MRAEVIPLAIGIAAALFTAGFAAGIAVSCWKLHKMHS